MRQVLFYRSRGGGLICGYRWVPKGEPWAVVQIIHGVADHASRYADFAEYLNTRGILVVAQDHMGHGDSVTEEAPLGYFNGGWFAAVDDTYQLYQDTRRKHPDLPYVLFGHSMGSFVARSILARYPDSGIDAAVICGTGWLPGAAVRLGQVTAELVCRTRGEKHHSRLLQKLMFGSYNARIPQSVSENDWISRDRLHVRDYDADPLCGFIPTAALVRDMMTGVAYIQEPSSLARMKRDLPVCFIAGTEDPVGNYGLGVEQAAEAFRQAGMTRVDMWFYQGARHEILGEINREEVFQDVGDWIESLFGRNEGQKAACEADPLPPEKEKVPVRSC